MSTVLIPLGRGKSEAQNFTPWQDLRKVPCFHEHSGGNLPVRSLCLAALPFAFIFMLSDRACGQATASKPADQAPLATSSPTRESEVPDVPGLSSSLHGFNGGITFAGIHDAITGWATLATPALGYSFNDIFTVDVSVPIYFFRLAPTTAARPSPRALLVQSRGEVADVVLAGHAQFVPRVFQYQATASVGIPTGSAKNGLTTGRVSFDFTNQFEHSFKRVSPNLEMGLGDSATLVNRVTTKNYTSLGPLAHFQVGASFPLPLGASFQAVAYEQLPIGDQKTYGPSRNGRSLVVTGRNVSEDNGFIDSLDIPVSNHITFSGYYNRSLRFHSDNVSIGVTFVLRAPPSDDDGMLNELLR